jgi:hypothetical protein
MGHYLDGRVTGIEALQVVLWLHLTNGELPRGTSLPQTRALLSRINPRHAGGSRRRGSAPHLGARR